MGGEGPRGVEPEARRREGRRRSAVALDLEKAAQHGEKKDGGREVGEDLGERR